MSVKRIILLVLWNITIQWASDSVGMKVEEVGRLPERFNFDRHGPGRNFTSWLSTLLI